MNKAFKERHDFVVAGLNAIPGISCRSGAGTFYAFADVQGAMRALGIKDDNAFAEYLLVQAGVAVVPGSGFGAPGSHAALLCLQHADACRRRCAASNSRWRSRKPSAPEKRVRSGFGRQRISRDAVDGGCAALTFPRKRHES